jgi:hypothetical protein
MLEPETSDFSGHPILLRKLARDPLRQGCFFSRGSVRQKVEPKFQASILEYKALLLAEKHRTRLVRRAVSRTVP